MSTLDYLLNGTGSSTRTFGAIWNHSSTGYSSSDPANVYSRSRIRNELIGDSTDAKAQVADGKNDYYGVDTMYDETNCLLASFPKVLQDAVVPRTTVNSTSSSSYRDKTTYDKLFLFSLKELGISWSYDDGAGTDYGVTSEANDRIAYEFGNAYSNSIHADTWWTRSRSSYEYSSQAGGISSSGAGGGNGVTNNYGGLSPGFCIA